jgi:hypothetical protein
MTINHKITTVVNSAIYLVAGDDEVILIDTPGPTTVVLPSDNANKLKSRVLYIKDYSGQAKTNPITIMSAGEKTIDGASSVTLTGAHAHAQLVHDGADWKIISQSCQLAKTKNKRLYKDVLKVDGE